MIVNDEFEKDLEAVVACFKVACTFIALLEGLRKTTKDSAHPKHETTALHTSTIVIKKRHACVLK
jgi:hypothetical protein